MAAQNVGARRLGSGEQDRSAGVLSGPDPSASSIALLLYIFNDQVLSILLPAHSPAIPLAHHINTTVLWGLVLFSVTFALSGVVRSTGAVWVPMANPGRNLHDPACAFPFRGPVDPEVWRRRHLVEPPRHHHLHDPDLALHGRWAPAAACRHAH